MSSAFFYSLIPPLTSSALLQLQHTEINLRSLHCLVAQAVSTFSYVIWPSCVLTNSWNCMGIKDFAGSPPPGLVPISIHNRALHQVNRFKYYRVRRYDLINNHWHSKMLSAKIHPPLNTVLFLLLHSFCFDYLIVKCSTLFTPCFPSTSRNTLVKIPTVSSKINHFMLDCLELNHRAVTHLKGPTPWTLAIRRQKIE